MFKFMSSSSAVNKNARNNCICLFIALGILISLAVKDQKGCGISYADSRKNAVSRFMLKYMHPCDALQPPQFRPPGEVAHIVGQQTPVSRRAQMQAYVPSVRYYKAVRSR